jgi:hypothetical protein
MEVQPPPATPRRTSGGEVRSSLMVLEVSDDD